MEQLLTTYNWFRGTLGVPRISAPTWGREGGDGANHIGAPE